MLRMVGFALVCSLVLVAQPSNERKEVSGDLKNGPVKVSYGSPVWKPEYTEEMKAGFVWRLGNNDPTSMTLGCGLACAAGGIPAGEYRLALRFDAQSKPELLVYDGTGFYQDTLMTWVIPASASTKNEGQTGALDITVDTESQSLVVRFGPMDVRFPLASVPMNEKYSTRFASAGVTVSTVALPAGKPFENACIGVVTATQRNNEMKYYIHFSNNGEAGTLTFKCPAATSIPKEKEAIERTIARMKEMLASAPDRKERIEARIASQTEALKKLEATATVIARFSAEKTVSGTTSDRADEAANLATTYERPEGSMTIIVGAGKKNHTFPINPREFVQTAR